MEHRRLLTELGWNLALAILVILTAVTHSRPTIWVGLIPGGS